MLEFLLLLFSTSVFEIEKKATSVPEIIADNINRMINDIVPITIGKLRDIDKKILAGSGSKDKFFS